MSESFNKCCPWGFVLLGIVLAAPPPLSAQQIDQGPAIDVEEYDISVQLRPSKQELQAVATVKFTASQERLGRVFLDFNGNLTVNRVYFADRPPAPGSLSKGSSPRRVASGRDGDGDEDGDEDGEEGVPHLRRLTPAPRPSSDPGLPAPEPVAPDRNLLDFQQDFDQHLLEVQFPRSIEFGAARLPGD